MWNKKTSQDIWNGCRPKQKEMEIETEKTVTEQLTRATSLSRLIRITKNNNTVKREISKFKNSKSKDVNFPKFGDDETMGTYSNCCKCVRDTMFRLLTDESVIKVLPDIMTNLCWIMQINILKMKIFCELHAQRMIFDVKQQSMK